MGAVGELGERWSVAAYSPGGGYTAARAGGGSYPSSRKIEKDPIKDNLLSYLC